MNFRLHAFEPRSRANGPGLRAVVWFQGCTLGCPGCFNPRTHRAEGGLEERTEDLADRISADAAAIEGFTFSGGEPLQQPEAVVDLLERLTGSGLGALLLTGLALGEIRRVPLGVAILERLDAVVAGRYVRSLHLGRGLLGSSNQRIHLLTDRYSREDFTRVPPHEVIIHSDGSWTATGIAPWRPGGTAQGSPCGAVTS